MHDIDYLLLSMNGLHSKVEDKNKKERSLSDKLTPAQTKNPNKKFYFAGTKHFCPNMKLNTVEKVCHVLKTGENEVHVSDETRLKSLVPLDKMLEMAK